MSKKFGIPGVMFSLVLACSFFAAVFARADIVTTGKPSGYNETDNYVARLAFDGLSLGQITAQLDALKDYEGFALKFSSTDTNTDFGDFLETVRIVYPGVDGTSASVGMPEQGVSGVSEYSAYVLWEALGNASTAAISFNTSVLDQIMILVYGLEEVTDPAPEQPVPEPATFALFGLGLVGAGLVARRRRK